MPPTPVKQMNPRRRAAVMANIRRQNSERSNRSLAQDWRVTAKNVIPEDASEDELRKWQKKPGRFDIQGIDTRLKQRRPATLRKAKASETTDAIKVISSNMPDGYEIHKWSYIDRTGKVTAHAVYFEGEPVFGQNKTFKSLTDARKAVKEHADTQRLLKQVRAERAYFEKHGHLGKTGYLPRPKDKE